MRRFVFYSCLIITLIASVTGCKTSKGEKEIASTTETNSGKEDGFTGVKPFYQDGTLLKEVTYRNGIRNGLTTTYYPNGMIRQTIFYTNEIKTDTARWYYTTGELYRITPYANDSINGTQIQYFRGGAVKAKMSFVNSVPKNDLVEYHQSGRIINEYPSIKYRISDTPSSEGIINIYLDLSNGSRSATWYSGSLTDGLFIESNCRRLPVAGDSGLLQLQRGSIKGKISVIAVYPTAYANAKYLSTEIIIPN